MSPFELKKPRCGDCMYSHQENGGIDCRRNPPIAMFVFVPSALRQQPEQRPASLFPPVNPDAWCGQFAQKIEKAN